MIVSFTILLCCICPILVCIGCMSDKTKQEIYEKNTYQTRDQPHDKTKNQNQYKPSKPSSGGASSSW